jgi:hypothetical protein
MHLRFLHSVLEDRALRRAAASYAILLDGIRRTPPDPSSWPDSDNNNRRIIELLGVNRPLGNCLHQSFDHPLSI